jgi:F420-dependent oxidoreductase-like protein
MRFGLQHAIFTFDGEGGQIFKTLTARARSAEERGFDSFWFMDHLMQALGARRVAPGTRPEDPIPESWTTLSSLIGVTKKIRLGTLVTGNIYRNPALLAKMGATVDVLSGGRLFMGVGAGWFEEEAEAYGIPHYDVPGRLKRLGEALQIIRGMWSEDSFSFEGKFYKVHKAICMPKPLQKPHPPIMIGGSGEKTLLRLVAKYGDACNFPAGAGGAAVLRHKLGVLKEHCKAVGRDYDEILKTKLSGVVIAKNRKEATSIAEEWGVSIEMLKSHAVIFGTPAQVKAGIRELAHAGIEYLILGLPPKKEEAMLKQFAEEIIPSFS